MALLGLGKKRQAGAGELLEAVVAASRRPSFFGQGRAPDTLEGRFAVLTLHAGLALQRLGGAPALAALAQSFTDQLFRHLDAGLREDGVGDLSVPKRMHKLAGAFFGQVQAYDAAGADPAALALALGRNVLGDDAAPFAQILARYVIEARTRQAAAAPEALFDPAAWPELPD